MNMKIENISYKYPRANENVLSSISLELIDGDVLMLLGLNGSGKTTLLKIIAGLLSPREGTIVIDNNNLLNIGIQKRSRILSYVSQKVNQLSDILVEDYLSFGFSSEMKFYEKPTSQQIQLVKKYAERFHITHLLEKKIDEISGGERQIVSICCALLQNTPILLLDEPTSALDLKNQYMVLSVLKEIVEEEKKIVILTSHNPNHALFLNSKIALIQNGRIANVSEAKHTVSVDNLREVYGDNICYSDTLPYREISFR